MRPVRRSRVAAGWAAPRAATQTLQGLGARPPGGWTRMDHGIEEYFRQRSHCRRRVALTAVGTGLVLLATIAVLQAPMIAGALRDTEVMRFGFAGPTRYVRLLRQEAEIGGSGMMQSVGHVNAVPQMRGGGGNRRPVQLTHDPREHRAKFSDPGPGAGDLVARALASQGRMPMFQSDELVIEKLVRPVVPDELREHDFESRVRVLALIDTTGTVVEAEVMQTCGEPKLDRASERAVLQCKFRPYREKGELRSVYAVFNWKIVVE